MNFISFLSSWLKDIVILFILITIAELIMPKGNMKKYINLVIGLLIIFTLINPFLRLLKVDFNLDQTVVNYSKNPDLENQEIGDYYLYQEGQVERLYKEKLAGEIRENIEGQGSFTLVDIDIRLADGDSFGQILELDILIGDQPRGEDRIGIRKVEKVDLEANRKERPEEASDFQFLKEMISRNFAVEEERIIIREER